MSAEPEVEWRIVLEFHGDGRDSRPSPWTQDEDDVRRRLAMYPIQLEAPYTRIILQRRRVMAPENLEERLP